MTKKLKNILVTFMGLGILLSPTLAVVPASALSQNFGAITADICSGIDAAGDPGSNPSAGGAGACGSAKTDNSTIVKLLQTVVNILSVIVGIIAVIMIVVGGFRYITSGGESSNVSAAKNAIIYAIVGLIIVALAQAIVRFVVNRALGSYS